MTFAQIRDAEAEKSRDTQSTAVSRDMAALRQAAAALAAVPLNIRAREVGKIIRAVTRERDSIVARIQAETGKSATDALVSEVLGALDYLHWLQHHAPRILRDRRVRTPLLLLGKRSEIWHEPLGVGLVITPWNYPFHIALTTVVTALVAGNAVALKPSEWTPLQGVMEAVIGASELFAPAFRVFYGDGKTGEALIDSQPDRVCFTGSIPTGRAIMAQCARYGIPVELELGGKDAAIVTDDVHVERTIAGILWGALTNSGQSCTSIEQLYLHERIADDVVEGLKGQLDELVVNRDTSGEADIGWMTTPFQAEKVWQQWQEAVARGGIVHVPLRRLEASGQVMLPGLIEVTDPQCALWQEETFGPVIAFRRYREDHDVIQAVNDLPFGLSASIWCRDVQRARSLARALNVGAVSVNNVMLTEGHPGLPFGGRKASGFGKVKGEDGLLGWVNRKAVMLDGQGAVTEPNWFPYTPEKYRAFEQLIQALFGTRGWRRWWGLLRAGLALDSAVKKGRVRAPD